MKNKILTFVLTAILCAWQLLANNANLEIDAVDGTYEYKGARVTEVDDGYLISVDAFKQAPGVYHMKFSKEHCQINRSHQRFESMNCSIDPDLSSQMPIFLLRRGPEPLERLSSPGAILFSLDSSSLTLLIEGQEIRFWISQIVTYKMQDRTGLAFPFYALWE